jgi:GT2 family glycosyltransferase
VVIPCYNYGRYLPECVGSVANEQPGVDVEIIIVDDKSTDDSLVVARALGAADARVRVLSNPVNQGAIATYNHGLAAATGEFVLLLSADDLASPGALTRASALLAAEESLGLVYGTAIHFRDRKPLPRSSNEAWIVWPGRTWLRQRCLSGYNVVASPEVVMRTSVLRAIGGYRSDLPHAGDFEMWLRTSVVSDIGFLHGVDQAYYRQHANNMHKTEFSSGTAFGALIDLQQRWRSFEVVFEGVGATLKEADELLQIARRTIARHALESINYAYARGFRSFPVREFEDFARAVDPTIDDTPVGRAFSRRKRAGMLKIPVHPLWAPAAVALRLNHWVLPWRTRFLGI